MQQIDLSSAGRDRRRSLNGLVTRWLPLAITAFILFSLAHAAWCSPACAKPAASTGTTPPRIAGGKWPAFSIAGDFDPKQIENPKVDALWIVDTKGRSEHIRLDRSSGSKPVDQAILRYVHSLHFTPAMKNGKPIAFPMQLPFDLTAGKG